MIRAYIKKQIRIRTLKNYWKFHVNSIYYFFSKIEKIIEPENLKKAEYLTYKDKYDSNEETIAEINRIIKADVKHLGFEMNSSDTISLEMLHTKGNEKYLSISIINENWVENNYFFKVENYPSFKYEKHVFYEDGFYFLYGGDSYKVPYWNEPIMVIFPLKETNKKIMIKDLWAKRIQNGFLFLK